MENKRAAEEAVIAAMTEEGRKSYLKGKAQWEEGHRNYLLKKAAGEAAPRESPDGSMGFDLDLEEACTLTADQLVKDWLKELYARGYCISETTGEF